METRTPSITRALIKWWLGREQTEQSQSIATTYKKFINGANSRHGRDSDQTNRSTNHYYSDLYTNTNTNTNTDTDANNCVQIKSLIHSQVKWQCCTSINVKDCQGKSAHYSEGVEAVSSLIVSNLLNERRRDVLCMIPNLSLATTASLDRFPTSQLCPSRLDRRQKTDNRSASGPTLSLAQSQYTLSLYLYIFICICVFMCLFFVFFSYYLLHIRMYLW